MRHEPGWIIGRITSAMLGMPGVTMGIVTWHGRNRLWREVRSNVCRECGEIYKGPHHCEIA